MLETKQNKIHSYKNLREFPKKEVDARSDFSLFINNYQKGEMDRDHPVMQCNATQCNGTRRIKTQHNISSIAIVSRILQLYVEEKHQDIMIYNISS